MKLTLRLAALLAVTASSAQAAVTLFTDRPSWEAALGGVVPVVEDLNSQSALLFADGETLNTGKLSITRDGSGNNADGLLEIVADGSAFGNLDGSTFLDGETGITPHEVVDIGFLGQPAFAFGADFFSPFSGDGIALDVDGELVLLDSIAGFNQGFVGVVSTNSFGGVKVVGNPDTSIFQELWSADNLSYAVIPEPSCLFGVIAAGISLLAFRRRSLN